MIVDEAFANIDSILDDMRLTHRHIRSSFRFEMAQAAKNPDNIYNRQPHERIFRGTFNVKELT